MSLESTVAVPEAGGRRSEAARRARLLTDAPWFSTAAVTAIGVNAVLLGAETYAGFADRWAAQMTALEHLLLGVFNPSTTAPSAAPRSPSSSS
ncbi:hypothetical protein ABZ070_33225 [Streptomyces sp. NPDC006283]|uniref:hypothetical protein n=1 Tax=Streptomyces sp. NPDC006283 TaxID=3156741 RepID=UPI0033A86F88